MRIAGWWASLSTRERRVVLGAGVAIIALLYWLAVWRPLAAAQERAAERLAAAREDLAWMQAADAQAARLKAEPDRTGRRGNFSLLALAEQSARSAGIGGGFRRGEPLGDDRLRVTLEAVSFDALVGWLELLETRYGIRADELAVNRGGSAGIVDARLLLTEPST